MSEWIVRLLLLSFAGTLLALLLFVLQPLLRKFVSHRILYLLWIVVMVRMVVPVGLASVGTGAFLPPPMPTAAVTQPAATQPAATHAPTAPAATAAPTSTHPASTPTPLIGGSDATGGGTSFVGTLTTLFEAASGAVDDIVASALDSLQPVSLALLLVWLLGALLGLSLGSARHRRLLRSLRSESCRASDVDQELLETCRRELGIRRPVELVHAKTAPTPFLSGIVRPLLCLPEREYAPEELRMVLLHELVHLKHRDLSVKLISNVVCALHWFNPGVYLIRHELSEAAELACDEAVSAKLGTPGRRQYIEVLLQQAAMKPYRNYPGTQALSESGRRLHQRLRTISQPPGAPRRKRVVGLTALLLLLVLPLPQFAPIALTGCVAPTAGMLSSAAVVSALRQGGIPAHALFLQPKLTVVLAEVKPTVYGVTGVKGAMLRLYVFASDDARREGVAEWRGMARAADNTGPEREYEVDNVFLFVSAGNILTDPDSFFWRIRTAMETLGFEPTPTVSPAATPDASPTDPSSTHLDFDWDVVRVDGVEVRSDPAVIDEFGFTPEGLCQGAIPGLKISLLEVSSPLGSTKEVIPLAFTIGFEGEQSVEFAGSAFVDEATGGAVATYRGTALGATVQAFYRSGRIHMTDRASLTALVTYLGYDIDFNADRTLDITTPVSLTPTPEPTRAPRYTLPKSALKYIGFGTFGSYVMALAGHDTGESGGSDTVFFLEGGGTVSFTFGSYFGEGDWRISVDGITVSDSSGIAVRTAGARTQLVASDRGRFAFQKGSLVLQQGGDVKVSELVSVFGSPISDSTVEGPGLHWEEGKKAWHRSMQFPGLEIELVQIQDATDKDVYEIAAEISTDASLTTPLGWMIGMSATDAIASAETIDWYLLPKVGTDGLLSRLDIVLPDFYGYGSNVRFTFEGDQVVSIGFNYVTVGS